MKKYLLFFLLCIISLCKGQTVIDNLNVTPNPFTKRTVAYYSFTQNDTVSLTVYNQFGQVMISLLTNSIMPASNYQDSIIMDAFSDGVYVVRLKLGVRKIIGKTIVKSASAGVNEIQQTEPLKIYPNPVLNTLFISEQKELINSEIEILNSVGQS